MIQYNHHAALVHTLWQKRNAKKNENLMVKNTASRSNIICSSTCFFFFRNQRTRKTKKMGEITGKAATTIVPGYTYHIKDALDNHEQTGGRAGCKRPRQRGTDASFTCVLLRSFRDVRRPRHLPNAKTAAIFQPDPDGTTKKQIPVSYFGDPQTGEVSY